MENEECKREIRTLEDEIEEMQDSFREDQASEYKDLKKELDNRIKDCRVLGFKLRRAESRSYQVMKYQSLGTLTYRSETARNP